MRRSTPRDRVKTYPLTASRSRPLSARRWRRRGCRDSRLGEKRQWASTSGRWRTSASSQVAASHVKSAESRFSVEKRPYADVAIHSLFARKRFLDPENHFPVRPHREFVCNRPGDPSATRRRIYSLARRDPQGTRQWLFEPSVRSGMSALDRDLFATARFEPPELNPLVKTITKAWRRAGHDDER
jgi:hypothetical protein